VIGGAQAVRSELLIAEEVGRLIAQAGGVLVCGGLGGVMDAAARGCAAAGGVSIGVLPGESRADASEHLSVVIPTGMGEARNALVVRAADCVIAVGGEFGTLSEIGLALKMGRPLVGIGTWRLERDDLSKDPIVRVHTPREAVKVALSLI
jgi:hypothetical protein